MIEEWRRVWRDGVVPLLSRDNLLSLKDALESDDPRLLQKGTTSPPPMQCVQEWPIERACPLAYMGARQLGGFAWNPVPDGSITLPFREGAAKVVDVETWFGRLCSDCDRLLDETAICRHLLNWIDDTPRAKMIPVLLFEVNLALAQKGPSDEGDKL